MRFFLISLFILNYSAVWGQNSKKAFRDSVKTVTQKLLKSETAGAKNQIDALKEDFKEVKDLANESLDLGLKLSKKIKDRQKEKQREKTVFDGKKYEGVEVEKRLIRTGNGNNLTFEEFYVLKSFQKPNPYIKDIYWYNADADRITTAIMKDKEENELLHGPYKKYLGEQLIEEGWYFIGTKHGRWEKYDKNFTLLDKAKYEKGFLADAEISYWDEQKNKIKEVVPKLYNKKTGDYFAFHENGTLATEGKFDNGVKVGRWIEYYNLGKKRKREDQYGKDFYDKTEPYTLREYDEKGKLTYEAPK